MDVAFLGCVNGPEAHDATSKAIAELKKHGFLGALVDLSKLESAPPLVDLYELPEKQYVSEGLSHRVHIAVVVPITSAAKQAARFYETVCVNRGWLVRSFPGRDEAIEWLAGQSSNNKPYEGDTF